MQDKRSRDLRPQFELLESRRMMAVTPELLHRGTVCAMAPSTTEADITYLIGTGGGPWTCGSNNNPQTLRRTDGTRDGTRAFETPPNDYLSAPSVIEVEDDIYFVGGHYGVGWLETLYRANGLEEKIEAILGPSDGQIWGGVELNGKLIIVQESYRSIPLPDRPNRSTSVIDSKLLAVDRDGVRVLKEIRQSLDSRPHIGAPVVVEDVVQFSIDRELWETNGTLEGTRFVKNSSSPTVGDRSRHVLVSVDRRTYSVEEGMQFIGSLEEVNDERKQKGEPPILDIVNHFSRVGDHLIFNARLQSPDSLDQHFAVFLADLRPQLPGDIQGDGNVDFHDFIILASHFGKATDALIEEGDLDGDDDIDFDDFLILIDHFGRTLEDVV